MFMVVRKGAKNMTNVLTNARNIIDTYEETQDFDKEFSRLELIFEYYKIKKVINEERAQKLIQNYIVKDKTINSGRATIKGTRVTPDDIGRVLLVKENMEIEDIIKEYPSLENEEQVIAGLIFYVDKNISLIKLLFAR